MPELPVEQTPEALEFAALRKANAELTQKSATRKARIQELEASVGTLTTARTDAETRIKALTIDSPVNELCALISKAPEALRSALESEYRIEMREGVLTLVNPTDGKQVMQDGKPVPFEAESIKSLLLASKSESNKKLYNAILVVSKATGGAINSGSTPQQRTTNAPKHHQFGLR